MFKDCEELLKFSIPNDNDKNYLNINNIYEEKSNIW